MKPKGHNGDHDHTAWPRKTPVPPTITVTPAQVIAAQIQVALAPELGETISPLVRRIAEAKVVRAIEQELAAERARIVVALMKAAVVWPGSDEHYVNLHDAKLMVWNGTDEQPAVDMMQIDE